SACSYRGSPRSAPSLASRSSAAPSCASGLSPASPPSAQPTSFYSASTPTPWLNSKPARKKSSQLSQPRPASSPPSAPIPTGASSSSPTSPTAPASATA